MRKPWFKACTASLLAASGALLLSACDAASSVDSSDSIEASADALDPNLTAPVVGDLWAAKLDEFSAQEFVDGAQEASASYGLMKVVAVNDESVTVITEMGAWPEASGSLSDLAGNQSDISWDENEEITVNRADFGQLVASGHILETRRLDE